eukprot:TRINITY_DN37128_c0_g1_i1.p1 TRINITY_DN37128_c0_g1~~TRINITY_DN37128_c0_g1_i1.p1  ORF type:complete len:365 (-),score=60.12 TRINITY_DN37128_c0_g1_i1:153-1247(-)
MGGLCSRVKGGLDRSGTLEKVGNEYVQAQRDQTTEGLVSQKSGLSGSVGASLEASRYTKWLILGIVTVTWFLIGIAFYMSEGYDIATSLYALMQIITTVGYGDVLPISRRGKMLMACLMLSSTLIIGGAISNLADIILDAQADKMAKQMQQTEQAIADRRPDEAPANNKSMNSTFQAFTKLVMNVGVFLFFVALGTIYFGYFESCTCSYGETAIEDCKDDTYDKCLATGGKVKTYLDAFYMSVTTLTTVGFGDELPMTQDGRIFSVWWMLFGVGSTINLVGTITDLIQDEKQQKKLGRITQELFTKMDADRSGTLDKLEFLTLQLEMNGKATMEEIQGFLRQFDMLDHSGDGHVDMEEVRAYYK